MLRSIYLIAFYLLIFGIGLGVPFVLTLGYVWVDMFRPNNVIFPFLRVIPVALLMGAAAVAGYVMLDRRAPPRIGAVIILTLLFSLWVTLTTFWAVAPVNAWEKWDWAFKSVLFSAFIPFAIRSRNQIEAFFQVYIFSLAANVIPFGVKTFVSGGGGYDRVGMGLMQLNVFLGQGETLVLASLSSIPIIFFLMQHGRIIPRNIFTSLGYLGLVVLALATAIGTHERTALVGLFVLAVALVINTKRKFLFVFLCLFTAGVIYGTAPASWFERMSTIVVADGAKRDTSSEVRLAVWKWTFDFAVDHPFGGGFDSYRINRIILDVDEENNIVTAQNRRAFHSSYFEVLGEHGWPGLGIFLSLLSLTFLSLRQVARRARGHPHLAWCGDLAYALQSSLAVMAACGALTGVAFQPFFWYWFALSYSLREYVRRVQDVPAPVMAQAKESFALART